MRSSLLVLFVSLFLCLMVGPSYGQTTPPSDSTVEILTAATPINLREVTKSMHYPLAWQQNGIKGKVIVKILVSADGTPQKHEILKSPHKNLTQSVETALYNLKFNPATDKNYTAVRNWVTIPFDFHPTY